MITAAGVLVLALFAALFVAAALMRVDHGCPVSRGGDPDERQRLPQRLVAVISHAKLRRRRAEESIPPGFPSAAPDSTPNTGTT